MLKRVLGNIVISDQNQALRLCLGTTALGAEYGAVSALSINHDCTRLLCGFAKGQVIFTFFILQLHECSQNYIFILQLLNPL